MGTLLLGIAGVGVFTGFWLWVVATEPFGEDDF